MTASEPRHAPGGTNPAPTAFDVRGRRALVVGLARSGVAAARLLLRRGAASVRAVDARPEAASGEAARELAGRGVRLDCGPHRAGQLGDADLVVVSPGVPPGVPPVAEARASGAEVVGEMELGARLAEGRLCGVTGSNGKSTTTTLCARMIAAKEPDVRAGGNLGTPLCEALLDGDSPATVHVLEVSSFQAETLERARFESAALLNVSPDHLDRYASYDDYRDAKLRLLDRVGPSGVVVLNADDAACRDASARVRAATWWFSLGALPGPGLTIENGRATSRIPGRDVELFRRDELWTSAPHHLANALAAAAVALAMGAGPEHVREGLRGFGGLPHRGEILRAPDGTRYVNDSKATNVDAAVHAIEGCDAGVAVILGGRHKGGSFAPLRDALVARSAQAVLIGEAAALFDEGLAGAVATRRASSLEEAVAIAAQLAGPGGTVLLAPACASFDMFRNYEHRGDAFKQAAAARGAS
jgi:UDP-N-acetylmuramoylalanine--D-glutamate ligase